MKKIGVSLLAVMMLLACTACGETTNQENAEIASAEELLNQVWDAFSEDETFAVTGGDYNHPVDGSAGTFDITDTDNLMYMLHVPETQIDAMDDGASIVHAMNVNTFTSAAFHMTDAKNAEEFVVDFEEAFENTQWMCGFPDIYKIFTINAGEYVVYALGSEDNVENFKTHLVEVYGDAVTVNVEERVE